MSILTDFKTFAMRGNVVDLAVGVIIGTAFGKIVSSLVANVIMPPLGLLISNVDFKDLGILLAPADPASGSEAVILGYGAFLQNCLDFLIIAWAVFLMVRLVNRFAPKPTPSPAVAKGPSTEELLTQIRDLLKSEAPKAPAKKK
ncbi:MAG: large-conductance mechanosensitive channel protein MscL [Alphaproteobacteria bacterium]|nr:MAG: large-conductance mechanosensitive channel protein MscL [Alphaproteobacteria bacterium]